MKGAPIRFVVAVVGGWVCIRIAVLLPETGGLAVAQDAFTSPAQAGERAPLRIARASPLQAPIGSRSRSVEPRPMLPPIGPKDRPIVMPPAIELTAAPTEARPADQSAAPEPIIVPAVVGPWPNAAAESRWSASAWLLARGGANGTLSGGQLGASQAGMRVVYRVDRKRRLGLTARIATPLAGRGTEAAIGVDWQPMRAPFHLVVEHRIAVDGARGGPTAMVLAGLNPTPIAAGFRLEAYAQGGAILRGGAVQPFGDGAARLTRPVAVFGGVAIDLGVGAWAAGQSGAARADVGPTIGAGLPVAGRRIRVSLDWRHRVAGHARPGSGPALSIGSDF